MGSQTDLDQGGTYRETVKIYLGPSIGWSMVSAPSILPITAGGTTVVSLGTSLVRVNVNAAVTLQLPQAFGNPAGAGAVPGSWVQQPITVVDIGGFATAHPITIQPTAGDLIAGLGSVQINSNYGSMTFIPNVSGGGWSYSI